jgi:hypothetical protein
MGYQGIASPSSDTFLKTCSERVLHDPPAGSPDSWSRWPRVKRRVHLRTVVVCRSTIPCRSWLWHSLARIPGILGQIVWTLVLTAATRRQPSDCMGSAPGGSALLVGDVRPVQCVSLVEDGPGLVPTESGTVHHASPCNTPCMEDALQDHADAVERMSPSRLPRVTVSAQGHADL